MGREVAGRLQRIGHTYTYSWSILMYGRNQHNIVIILQLKIKKRNEFLSHAGCIFKCLYWAAQIQNISWLQKVSFYNVQAGLKPGISWRAPGFHKLPWLWVIVPSCCWLGFFHLQQPETGYLRLWFSQNLSSWKYFTAATKRMWGCLQEGCSKKNLG